LRDIPDRFVAALTEAGRAHEWQVYFKEDNDVIAFERPLAPGVRAQFDLDITWRKWGGLFLNPGLSVRHVEVSDLVARLLELRNGGSQVGTNIADLAREHGRSEWVYPSISSVEEIPQTVVDVLRDVEEFGALFHSRFASVSGLIAGMEDRLSNIWVSYAQFAVANAVAYGPNVAEPTLSRLDAMLATEPELVASQLRGFLSRFRAHFDVS